MRIKQTGPGAELVASEGHPLLELAGRIRDILDHGPSGLVSDLDGTLSALAPTPGKAVLIKGCRTALKALLCKLPLLAVISGRRAIDIQRMVRVEGVVYVGNHGMERLDGRHSTLHPACEAFRDRIEQSRPALQTIARRYGLRLEDKGITIALHWRQRLGPDPSLQNLLEEVTAVCAEQGLRTREGKMVLEVLPPVDVHKGTALIDLADARALRGLVYIGDDATDLDAFRALAQWRGGDRQGICLAVDGPETHAEILGAADTAVDSPKDVVRLLGTLARI